MDFFTFFVLVSLGVLLIYARNIEKRRRRDAEKYSETTAALTARIHALEQQSKMPWAAGHTEGSQEAAPQRPVAPPVAAPKLVSPLTTLSPLAPPAQARTISPAEPHGTSITAPKAKEVVGTPLAPTPAKEVAHPLAAAAASTSIAPPKPAITPPPSMLQALERPRQTSVS